MTFIIILCGFIGFVFAVKLGLVYQLLASAMGVFYLNSDHVRGMEIGALFPMAMFAFFVIGLVLGDIYYLVAFVPEIGTKIGGMVAWLFKP